MPQKLHTFDRSTGEGTTVDRNPEERSRFAEMLTEVGLLFIGCNVLAVRSLAAAGAPPAGPAAPPTPQWGLRYAAGS